MVLARLEINGGTTLENSYGLFLEGYMYMNIHEEIHELFNMQTHDTLGQAPGRAYGSAQGRLPTSDMSGNTFCRLGNVLHRLPSLGKMDFKKRNSRVGMKTTWISGPLSSGLCCDAEVIQKASGVLRFFPPRTLTVCVAQMMGSSLYQAALSGQLTVSAASMCKATATGAEMGLSSLLPTTTTLMSGHFGSSSEQGSSVYIWKCLARYPAELWGPSVHCSVCCPMLITPSARSVSAMGTAPTGVCSPPLGLLAVALIR